MRYERSSRSLVVRKKQQEGKKGIHQIHPDVAVACYPPARRSRIPSPSRDLKRSSADDDHRSRMAGPMPRRWALPSQGYSSSTV